jgi:hypothetical protein
VQQIAERGGTWDEVLAAAAINAPSVTKVGEDLDRIVTNLLRVIGIDAYQAFGQQTR